MNQSAQQILDILYARRSVRAYQDKPVEPENIELLLKAAMAAPSACNLQPWEFVVINQPESIKRIKPYIGGGKCDIPLIVAVCANVSYLPWEGEGWMIDCAAAVENMMTMATALGLGSLWIGNFEQQPIRELLRLPEHVKLMNLIYFGYPAKLASPRTQYTDEAVYWQEYDPQRVHPPRTVQSQLAKNTE